MEQSAGRGEGESGDFLKAGQKISQTIYVSDP